MQGLEHLQGVGMIQKHQAPLRGDRAILDTLDQLGRLELPENELDVPGTDSGDFRNLGIGREAIRPTLKEIEQFVHEKPRGLLDLGEHASFQCEPLLPA